MLQFVNFNRTCPHFNTMDDFSNGCEVFTDCGLVMHEQIYAQYSNQVETLKLEKSGEHAYRDKDNFAEETMWRVCNKCNIECSDLKRVITRKWNASGKAGKEESV